MQRLYDLTLLILNHFNTVKFWKKTKLLTNKFYVEIAWFDLSLYRKKITQHKFPRLYVENSLYVEAKLSYSVYMLIVETLFYKNLIGIWHGVE